MSDKKPEEDKRSLRLSRQTIETLLWLLVIIGLLVLVLQAMGYLSWFQLLKGKAAVIGLAVIGVALLAGAVYSYLQSRRLREAVRKLAENQARGFRAVTLLNGDSGEDDAQQEENKIWKEKVKFTAVIEERQRLARELHDAVSQQLFAISMTATAVGRTLDKDFERARRQVELIEEMASVAQSEMRALLLHLRPIHLDGKNLGQALGALLDELKQKVAMDIQLEYDPTIHLMTDAEDHLFRIVQEALSNTLRHARATAMEIRLLRYGKQIHLLLRDNGVGFDLEDKKQTSYGLLTMEERVHEMGGTMELRSAPGEGTTIEIWIPVLTDERGSE